MKHPPITQQDKRLARPLPQDYIDDLRQEFPDLHLSDAQATEILTTIYEVMASHVRMGFGLEPVGKLIAAFETSTTKALPMVNSEDATYEP